MAEETGYDRTEAPTQRRRQEARAQGQVAVSPDLSAGLLVLAGIGIMALGARGFGGGLLEAVRSGLSQVSGVNLEPSNVQALFLGLFGRALELMLTNRTLDAAEACDWGIVTRVVPAADLDREAEAFAAALARGATGALRAAKRLVREGWSDSLETQLERETREIVERGGSNDAREGITAFVERREPRFQGV